MYPGNDSAVIPENLPNPFMNLHGAGSSSSPLESICLSPRDCSRAIADSAMLVRHPQYLPVDRHVVVYRH